VNAPAPDIIRLTPPLIITEAQIDEFLAALPDVLEKGRDESLARRAQG
ncbi:MAG TPA: acetylornithine transaminase, partial [Mycobacterium sp.]